MKLGAENSKKTLLAVGLLIVALFLTYRMISGSLTSSAATPPAATAPAPITTEQPVRRPRRAARPAAVKQTNAAPTTPNLDLRLRLDSLRDAETTEYTGQGRNIFMAHNEPAIPEPVKQAMKTPPPPPPDAGPPQPPPPPPIKLKFFGFANQQGARKVFLSSGDDVIVAGEGEIVQRRYRIVKVNPNNIEVQDVLNNNVQTIPLTAG